MAECYMLVWLLDQGINGDCSLKTNETKGGKVQHIICSSRILSCSLQAPGTNYVFTVYNNS